MNSVVSTMSRSDPPAAFRIASNLRKICRVWATMSPRPMISWRSSVAVVPEMNRRLPLRTAGENVYRSGQGVGLMASMSRPAAHQVDVKAIEDRLAALILEPRGETHDAALALFLEPDDLVLGIDRVADGDRLHEARPLLQERDHRLVESMGERRRAHGGQAHQEEAVGETEAERSLLCVLLVVVDRVIVTGQPGEEREVGVVDRARRTFPAVPEPKIVPVQLSVGHHLVERASVGRD